jgi:phosphoribosylformylglycinamidine synthase II/phosphoribosylformylglycinamidine synthase I
LWSKNLVFALHRIEINTKSHITDTEGQQNRFIRLSHELDINSLTDCIAVRLFFLQGTFTQDELHNIIKQYLADPVTDFYTITQSDIPYEYPDGFSHRIEVAPLAGVTNSVADNLTNRIQQAGIGTLNWATTATQYLLAGDISDDELRRLAEGIFTNETVQHYTLNESIAVHDVDAVQDTNIVERISLADATDDELIAISQERRLSLDGDEMKAIQDYFIEEQRDPTDLELEMLAQTWSEHCVHKTFRAHIDYTDSNNRTKTIHGLLKTYIRGATDKLDKPWLRSVFVDNAGIIRFDDEFDIAFKVETHNHPSAIEPFGGSNTGVGGVVRDVLGVSAKPIANTDVLCFGPQDLPMSELPTGALHPQRIASGVIHGVEDYGNKMGIPTVNGAVLYHEGYTANPLVFCGCLGILPNGSHPTDPQAGDYIISLGGRTGRDGLRGATFSSMEMDASTGTVAGSSVQIGNPIIEKQVQEVIIQARDEKLYTAITDCGAGGLSSAVGEMTQSIGATVQLQTIPLKYAGLQPWEIWLSEAQERMVVAVPPGNWERLQVICDGQDVEAIHIGTFEATGRIHIQNGDETVGDMAMAFLHDGIPTRHLQALWQAPDIETIAPEIARNSPTLLADLLAHPNIRSKESIVRRYDHEIQGATRVKPFGGTYANGHNDGAVLIPVNSVEGHRGIALSNGVCPQYTELDPYAMAWAAIDEAIRNAVAVGVDPEQVAILDNFCWGNPNLPDRLGSLVRNVQGCYDAALTYGTPFISGKDSLNNEYTDSQGNRHAIPGTLLISAVGIVPDARKTATSDFKQDGNIVYVIGQTRDELGASHYAMLTDQQFATVPQPADNPMQTLKAIHQAMQAGYIQACHDVSEGGLAVAIAEMCIGGDIGAEIDLTTIPQDEKLIGIHQLYSESLTRFVVEIKPEYVTDFEALLEGVPFTADGNGKVITDKTVSIAHGDGTWTYTVSDLARVWGTDMPDPSKTARLAQMDSPNINTNQPKILILHANGTNRDHDVALACKMAGGDPEIVHINQLRNGEKHFADYNMLVVPGGFSYGDDLGAGRLWSLDLRTEFAGDIAKFVDAGRPIIGICNGFQTLVKSGLLPDSDFENRVTLTYNESAHFECRWVYLQPNPNSPSLFTRNLNGLIYCPVAHGEGRLLTLDGQTTQAIQAGNLHALTYVNADGSSASYPANPNGSIAGIAGLSNRAGNVFGLMPHPENHIFHWQHPRVHRKDTGGLGLSLFINGVQNA